MQVDTPHPDYIKHERMWRRCRDVVDGEDAVKDAGQDYLPKLEGQSDDEYDSYKMRALFYNAAERTVMGILGLVTRRPPTITDADFMQEQLDSFGRHGESFEDFTNNLLRQVLIYGRAGVLVDLPNSEPARPYAALYHAPDIISWVSREIDGKQELTQVVLRESVQDQSDDDPFRVEAREQYRVLRLVWNGDADRWQYTQQLYKRVKSKVLNKPDTFALVQVFNPTVRGVSLDRIPFVIANASSVGTKIEQSPIAHLANVNLSHYRTSADLEHGRHFTALPTPWAAGFGAKASLTLGSTEAWVSEEPTARAGFLEFTGNGLSSLEKALEEKERLMAVVGARLLETKGTGVEAAEAIRLRHSGEESVIAGLAKWVSLTATFALRAMAKITHPTQNAQAISVELNQDYSLRSMTSDMLNALTGAKQGGHMSARSYFYALQRGEMFADDWTFTDELQEIELDRQRELGESPREGLADDELGEGE